MLIITNNLLYCVFDACVNLIYRKLLLAVFLNKKVDDFESNEFCYVVRSTYVLYIELVENHHQHCFL